MIWSKFEHSLFSQIENRVIWDNHMLGIQWHITSKCQERCYHCYIHERDSNFPEDKIEMTLDKIYEGAMFLRKRPVMTLIGGDPLLYPHIEQILDLSNVRKIKVNISGNPHSINPETIKWLEKKNVYGFQLSLDGPEHIHDAIRSGGSYKNTIRAIDALLASSLDLRVKSVIHKNNIDFIPTLYRELASKGVGNYIFCRYVPVNNKDSKLISDIDPNKFREFLSDLFDEYRTVLNGGGNSRIIFQEHLIIPFLYQLGILGNDTNFVQRINEFNNDKNGKVVYEGCSLWLNQLVIETNGDVYGCRKLPVVLGNIFSDDVYDLTKSKEQLLKLDQFEKCSRCKLIFLCRGCPAISAAITGNMYDIDPQCWVDLGDGR